MKNVFTFCFCILAIGTLFAQVPNNDFENWETRLANSVFPGTTYIYNTPEDWTAMNQVTNDPVIVGIELVTEETSFVGTGSSSIRLESDSISAFGFDILVPGLCILGEFEVDITALAGGNIDPSDLQGAGIPYTDRPASFDGFYNYVPVGMDECYLAAFLMKDGDVIASAEFASGATAAGYQSFSADFEYESCDNPDTLIIALSSSNVDLTNGGGQEGSVLYVDGINVIVPAGGLDLPPFAEDDMDSTMLATAVMVDVQDNDIDCEDGSNLITSSVTLSPANGTAIVVTATGEIEYTPNPGFDGIDGFEYEVCDQTGNCSEAMVWVLVENTPLAPVAMNDWDTTAENTLDTIPVLMNDSDGNNDPLTINTISIAPSHGTANISGADILYMPDLNFDGDDSLQYEVCDGGGLCDMAWVYIHVMDIVSVKHVESLASSIYPNPTSEQINIQLETSESTTLRLYDAQSRLVLTKELQELNNSIDVSHLVSGNYMLQLQSADKLSVQQIVIE